MEKGLHFKILVFIFLCTYSFNLKAQFWQVQSGLGGGGIQVCHTDSNWFLIDNYSIYKSEDEGLNWQRIYSASGFINSSILAKGNTLFKMENFEIYRSVDEGTSWTLSTPPSFSCYILSKDEQYIYAANNQRIVRSGDDGITWLDIQMTNTNFDKLAVSQNRILIAEGSFNYVKISSDTGATFITIGGVGMWSGVRALFCANTSLLLGSENGLFISLNQGSNWTRVNDIPDSSEVHSIIKDDSTLYLATSTGTYKSTNDGVNWSQLSVEDTDLIDAQNGVLIADIGYLKRSINDGLTWAYAADGITNVEINSLFTDGNDVYSENFYSPDNGISWEPRANGIGKPRFNKYAKMGSYIYVGMHFDGFFRTSDQGLNWTSTFDGSQISMPTDILIFDSLIFVSNYHNTNRIFVSADSGFTWTAASNGLPFEPVFNLQKKQSEIYCATLTKIFKSIDAGQNWIALNGPDSIYWRLVLVNDDLIIAGGYNNGMQIHFSTDDGNIWNQMSTNWSDTATNIIDAIIYNNTLIVAALEPNGIFMTSDTGQSWVEITSNFCDFQPDHATKLGISGSKLLAGSSLNGIWETDLAFLSSNDNFPEKEILSVYPNPVDEKFSIVINSSESHVKGLIIFDLLGNALKTITAPGLKNSLLEVDVKNFSQGIYLVKVQFENNSYTAKFVKL